MTHAPEILAALGRYDTPTICNALELVAPERRATGFTTRPLFCARPELPPIVGYARTATIRASRPPADPERQRETQRAYYQHVAEPPHPTVTVIEDVDPEPGFGAWWGEVNTNLHRGLGSTGVITNGSIRDLAEIAERFQLLAGSVGPSHAHVHPVEVGVPVEVAGMRVAPGDLIHADRHGAVVVPPEAAPKLAEAAERVVGSERPLIEASRKDDFSLEKLEKLFGFDPRH